MAGPRLAAARLIRANRSAAGKIRRRVIAAAAYALIMGLLWARREWLASAIEWLRLHSVVCAGLAGVATAMQVARRRVLKRAEFARSWLAAVPIAASARGEALIIETFPATAALVLLLMMAVSCGVILAASHAGSGGSLLPLWAAMSAGVAVGVIFSYAIPAPKPAEPPPGSRYVPHQKSNRAAKIRPSLASLGAWPVRQMFAWAQPKMVARATLPILIMMPLGTTADQALGAVAVFAVTGSLVLLWTAAVSLSRRAYRWVAPLPVRTVAVTRAFLLPTMSVMAGASAVEFLLLLTFDVSYRTAAVVGIVTSLTGCLATLGGAWLWQVNRRGAR
jgi:hypothetical protein